jgi:citrate synthase
METDHSSWTLHPDSVVKTGWTIFQTFLGALPYPDEGIRQALILCADHDLTASTLSARIAASTQANPYAVVMAALATLSGSRHGGACALAEALVEEAARSNPRQALVSRLKRGDALAGFGHRLYPKGDPRARLLLGRSPVGQEWTEAGLEVLGEYPSLDLALVLALQLPSGGAFQVFACGRVLGWIAHALEQYGDPKIIRARSSTKQGIG